MFLSAITALALATLLTGSLGAGCFEFDDLVVRVLTATERLT